MSLFSKTKTHPGTQQETNPTPRQEIAEPTTDPQRQPSPQSAVKPLLGGKYPRGHLEKPDMKPAKWAKQGA